MIPLKLHLSGFLSYRNKSTLDFRQFDIACISGPNGAGKSSLLDAITWVLFGQARKRDESLVNTNPDIQAAEVSLDFAYEGNIYRVMRALPRGKVTNLEFFIFQDSGEKSTTERISAYSRYEEHEIPWKPLTERMLRETQRRIEGILRMDYETFVNASFFLQGKADLFTQQRPADRKRILGNILGLEIWEEYRQKTFEQRKAFEAEIAGLTGRLAEIEAELAEEQPRKNHLQELQQRLQEIQKYREMQETQLAYYKKIEATLEEQRNLVQALSRQRDTTQRNMHSLNQRLNTLHQEQIQQARILPRADEIEAALAEWQAVRQKLSELDQIAARYREQEKRRQEPLEEINAERARLLEQKENLEKRNQELAKRIEQVAQIEHQIQNLQLELEQVETKLKQRTELEALLEEVRQQIADASAENPRLKKEMEEFKERIDRLQASEKAECPLCGQPLSGHDKQGLIEHLTVQGATLGDRFRANRELLTKADQRSTELHSQINKLAKAEKERLSYTEALTRFKTQVDQISREQQEWQEVSLPRLTEIKNQLDQERFALEARKKIARIDRELKRIGYDAAYHDVLRQEENDRRAVEQDYLALELARTRSAVMASEISNLENQQNSLQSDLIVQTQELDQAVAKLAGAEAQAPDIQATEKELLSWQEQENQMRLEMGAARQKVDVLVDLKIRRRQLLVQREEKNARVGQHKQLERAFSRDGVPALLIEQALPQIEAQANETLERLTGGEMRVQFITQAQFKDKKREDLRETLDIRIGDSSGIRDYEMYSGGEAFRVNFAIRLALSEVLARRAGARLQTLVIDEGFGSQDTQGRQKLIEAINLVRQDFAKILVITHIEELKEAFPNRIEVEKTEHGSTIRSV